MTQNEKLSSLKTILFGNSGDGDSSINAELTVYLNLTKQAILQFKYRMVGGVPEDVTDVSAEDEVIQIMACAEGYAHKGGQGESRHNENGIDRTWKYDDMLAYVHEHVIAYAGVAKDASVSAE